MARTSNFANVATVTRASTKTDAGGWDFTSGGTVGTLAEYASGVAAIHSTAGLLVEESTTNEIRNPRFEGATVGTIGSGGALPTNFALGDGGMTWTVDAVGTESGMDYLQITLSGTASADAVLYFEPSNQIAALTGEDWTLSVGMKVTAGTFPGNFLLWLRGLTSGGSTSDDLGTQDPDPTSLLDGSIRRFFVTKTLNNNLGTTAYVRPALYIDNPSGAVSCTFRLYATQCENKAYPTSPALPVAASPAASTRAADVVSIPYGAWGGDEPYTVYAEYQPAGQQANILGYIWTLEDDANTYISAYSNAGNVNVFVVNSAVAVETKTIAQTHTEGSNYKLAVRNAFNDFAMSSNGQVQVTDSSWTVASTDHTKLMVGANPADASQMGGYIRDFRFWPTGLTNAELEALVGN